MENIIHKTLSRALHLIFASLARILLSRGIAYGDVAEILRKSYVEEGFGLLKRRGNRASVSAVSALTGLTRKETARLKELPNDALSESSGRYNRVVRVVSAWRNQAAFQKSNGKPAQLELEGKHSFAELVRRYSGDITSRAMLDILLEAKLVRLHATQVELLRPAYIPEKDISQKLSILGIDVAELVQTIDHNINCSPVDRKFQRKVSIENMDPKYLPAFRKLAEEKSQQLLEELDQWLSQHEADPNEQHPTYVALGIYFFDKPTQEN